MGDYKINNTVLYLEPESGEWVQRKSLGVSGNGHAVYSGYNQFELRWSFMPPSGTAQMYGWYNLSGITGTISVDLPTYAGGEYTFTTYSGCVMYEPTFAAYMDGYYTDFVVKIGNIRR